VLVDATAVPADRGALGRYVDGLVAALGATGADLAVACQRNDEERYGRLVPEATLSLEAGGGPDLGPVRVPPGKVLLLGDNRGNSRDGRTFGFVDRERVLGRALAVVARDGRIAYEPL